MKNINKVFIGEEKIYLKKDFIGWHVIHPWKNEDGTINWFNTLTGGSWWHILITFIIVLLIVGVIYEYTSNINTLLSCFNDPIMLEECKQSFGYKEWIINP